MHGSRNGVSTWGTYKRARRFFFDRVKERKYYTGHVAYSRPYVRTYVRVPCTSCADPTCTIAHCIALLYGTGLRWRGTGVGDTRRFDTPFSRWRVSFRINLTAGITRIDEGKLDRVSIIDKDFRLDRDYFSFLEREVMDSRRRWKKKGYSCSLRYGRSFAGFVHAIAVYVPYIML